MKCKRPSCLNEARIAGMVYCSKGCAPLAHLAGSSNIISRQRPVASYSEEHGVRWDRSKPIDLGDRQKSEPEPPSKENGSEYPKPPITEPIKQSSPPKFDSDDFIGQMSSGEQTPSAASLESNETESTSENSGENGMPETAPNIVQMKPPGESGEILPASSVETSRDLQQESLVSLNLINDSASYLFDLMKGIGREAKSQDASRINPQLINAACNCGKQITSLLRLKLDVLKASKIKGTA